MLPKKLNTNNTQKDNSEVTLGSLSNYEMENKPFSGCLFFNANAMARLTKRAAEKAFKPLNISASLAYLLVIILKNPGIQASELAKQMILKASTVTRLLDKLEKLNYITKETKSKFVYIFPTDFAIQNQSKLDECSNNLTNFYKKNIDCVTMKNATDISLEIALKLERQ